jgi:hypothetical protein
MSIKDSNTQPHLLRSDVDRLECGRDSPLLRSLGSANNCTTGLSGPGAPCSLSVLGCGQVPARTRVCGRASVYLPSAARAAAVAEAAMLSIMGAAPARGAILPGSRTVATQ